MRDTGARGVLTLALVALIGGCGTDRPGSAPATLMRDSAGITVVESRRGTWAADSSRAWHIAARPDVQIGAEQGPAEYEFQEVAGALRLRDGRLVVADAGSSEIRVYDGAGRYLRAAGGKGDGPGEYRLINAIGTRGGETIWVYDFGLRRFTVLGPALTVARTVELGGALSAVAGAGMLPDGGFVVYEYFSSGGDGELTEGLRRSPVAVARLDSAGAVRDTIVVVAGRETAITSEGGRAVMNAPVVSHAVSVALMGDAVVVGDQATWELRVIGLDGALRRIIRRPEVDLRLSADQLNRLIDERLRTVAPGERAATRAYLVGLPEPDSRPAYGDILADDAGRLWVAHWAPADRLPTSWSVFDPEGRLQGDVAMPPGFRPLSIRGDEIVGVARDDQDVERVQVRRIERE